MCHGHDISHKASCLLLTRRGAGGGGLDSGPQSDKPPEVGSVHDAVVERIQPYGVFVRLAGFRKFGLVHSRQVRLKLCCHGFKISLVPCPCLQRCQVKLCGDGELASSQLPTRLQVSDHLEFGKEDTDEEKISALSSILAIGEACKVKVVEVAFDERCDQCLGWRSLCLPWSL